MNDKLIDAWMGYLMRRCAANGTYCPCKGCPMESYDECIMAREEVKKIMDEHTVVNATVNAINELRKKSAGK